MNGCNFGHFSFVVGPVIVRKLTLMDIDDRSLCCKFDVEMDMIVGYEDLDMKIWAWQVHLTSLDLSVISRGGQLIFCAT